MKYCNVFYLIDDSEELRKEYKRRHDEIWPEMKELITEAGFYNYTIWNKGRELIDFYELNDLEHAQEVLAASDVKKRWDATMKDFILFDNNDNMISSPLKQMFEINCD